MLIRRFPVLEGFLRFADILAPLGLRSMPHPLTETRKQTTRPAIC
jgi:hypothetical protein